MIDTIKQLVRSGDLLKAALQLDEHLRSLPDADKDLCADAAVLVQNLNILARDEKRRKLKGDALMDAKTRYGYELMDLLDQLPEDQYTSGAVPPASSPANTVPSASAPLPPVTTASDPPVPPTGGTTIINYGNIGSINISNEVRTEINNFGNGVQELQKELEPYKHIPEVAEALALVGGLNEATESLKKAEDVTTAQGPLSRIKAFFDGLESKSESASKMMKTVKTSGKILGTLAATYNSIAQWAAMPVVPQPLVKWMTG